MDSTYQKIVKKALELGAVALELEFNGDTGNAWLIHKFEDSGVSAQPDKYWPWPEAEVGVKSSLTFPSPYAKGKRADETINYNVALVDNPTVSKHCDYVEPSCWTLAKKPAITPEGYHCEECGKWVPAKDAHEGYMCGFCKDMVDQMAEVPETPLRNGHPALEAMKQKYPRQDDQVIADNLSEIVMSINTFDKFQLVKRSRTHYSVTIDKLRIDFYPGSMKYHIIDGNIRGEVGANAVWALFTQHLHKD